MASQRHFAVKLVRSGAGRSDRHRATLAGLGLKHVNQTVYLKDTPANRGMIYQVVYLLEVTPRDGAPPPSKRQRQRNIALAKKKVG